MLFHSYYIAVCENYELICLQNNLSVCSPKKKILFLVNLLCMTQFTVAAI